MAVFLKKHERLRGEYRPGRRILQAVKNPGIAIW